MTKMITRSKKIMPPTNKGWVDFFVLVMGGDGVSTEEGASVGGGKGEESLGTETRRGGSGDLISSIFTITIIAGVKRKYEVKCQT